MTHSTSNRPKPVVLCILDGWGESDHHDHNAIHDAKTPNWDRFMQECPHSLVETSGLAVGLPEGQMGNSEVGHMNIGSGRIVMQDLPRIDQAIKDGSLAQNPELQKLIAELKRTGRTCHLLGLISPGGVHSHQKHVEALAQIIGKAGVRVAVHAFLDGRDTPPSSAVEYIKNFEAAIKPYAYIATISGRYYAMDRDKRWDRVSLAYDTMVLAEGLRAKSALQAIETSYQKNKTDEFVMPTVVGDYDGMSDGDAIIMANFRADRARQMLHALVDPSFNGFERKRVIHFAVKLGMVEYSEELNNHLTLLFAPERLDSVLGEVLAEQGLSQLRIAETEKYAHVTFFFNGGREQEFKGEERILVPSPKVATYDLQPEMSAPEITAQLEKVIAEERYDVIVVNYANTDMVGHTGDLNAAVKAVETVDACLGRVAKALEAKGGVMLISADHGNAEQMHDDETGQPHTAHTTNVVPFIVVGKAYKDMPVENGKLCDIAPTILHILGIAQPASMTGKTLITNRKQDAA